MTEKPPEFKKKGLKEKTKEKYKSQVLILFVWLLLSCCWRLNGWEWGQHWAWFGVDVGGVDPRCSWEAFFFLFLVNLDRSCIYIHTGHPLSASELHSWVREVYRKQLNTAAASHSGIIQHTQRLTTRAYLTNITKRIQENILFLYFFLKT